MGKNPLLQPFNNRFNAPPFNLIENSHYTPAFEEAVKRGREEIAQITTNSESPTFQNTILALEFAARELGQTSSIFFNLNSAHTNSDMEQSALTISPLLSAFSNETLLNRELFKRVKSVYLNRGELNLTQEQIRLTEESYRGFVRNGADIEEQESRERLSEINSKLSKLSLQFGQNLLASTNGFTLHITKQEELEGLPSSVIESAQAEAIERSLEGWLITLQQPSFIPFMQYSSRRDLREKLWRAYNSRALSGEFDNREIILSIVRLRAERALILGKKNHASFVISDNMAKSAQRVEEFLNSLLSKALPAAKNEVAEIEQYALERGANQKMMPWDFSYWSEKLKQERYSIDDQVVKPYFSLEQVERGIFELASRLWGIKFSLVKDLPTYHKDVKIYEVLDCDNRHLSLLYIDYFARGSKRGGAWMTTYRGQEVFKGKERRSIVSLVLNFQKPTTNTPSLLTFNDVTTFLHEFGHAFHAIMAEGSYPSLTGTNVVRDFVELPSQIMENWAYEGEFLSSFATHYKTGEAIPSWLVEKLKESRNYLSGYSTVRQLGFALCDLAWHTLSTDHIVEDPLEFENEALAPAQLFPKVEGTAFSTSFSHIFAGGYSAGYYSYKWAEVLEADAFSLFKERGIFNREVAASFRKNILSKGNLEDAALLFKKFRGRDPEERPFLEKFGLDKAL